MSALTKLNKYLLAAPRPLIGAETIQLILLREVLDYTVLRTEDTRELNSAITPLSESDRQTVAKRVAFLGSKQKAAESRQMEYILRSAALKEKKDVPSGKNNPTGCFLKDNLCLQCPRCALYGGSALGAEANIKHRIEYSTAFSLLPFDQITEEFTFNAVSETTQTTGQALGSRNVVKPASLFPSIVTLKSVTRAELVLVIKTLLACKSYGAESRTGGDCRNSIFAVGAGWEEIITPLELTLELYDQKEELSAAALGKLLESKYKSSAGNPGEVTLLEPDEIDALVKECAQTELSRSFLDDAYSAVAAYRKLQS